jgi:hypothetical protein
MDCFICGTENGGPAYPNEVCRDCDHRAVDENGDEPWEGWPPGKEPKSEDGVIHMAPDTGANPVFIDGRKCWRRYRFGGWITMADEHDCDSIEEFYEVHKMI